MKHEYKDSRLGAILGFTDDIKKEERYFSETSKTIKFLWNRNGSPLTIQIDGLDLELLPNQIITVTYLQHVSYSKAQLPITGILFNREFYCISDHDSEVSCNGILFFGTQDIPVITIGKEQLNKFNLLHDMFIEEFSTPDNIQGDMLQMLLKRLIIMSTRLAKEQLIVKTLGNDQIDTIRRFNFLVDMHYKTKRKVSEYAELLHKSPKTLSNLFSIYNQKSPQQIILDRIALEAKRLINFTDKQNQEIAYELGFNDPAHFSRFFKKMTQMTPSEYRENLLLVA
ncbi:MULTISPECIES: helix-turn-helix domain-containing protein [Flavobacteriaceae]|uniref:Transcriptional regulator n=1 Tax=Flagellimonas marinaquae TaxID=254955 RepID=A0AA48KQL6_9FLAO|nr:MULTISPECIES: helix-turn-helix domain-containing protein [Allomuricauda]MCA0958792.1 helix-turn-helix domain-containing protein [Allomuricauda ruestringensis]USD26478.1 helix-turn-helix domain-containing protein [Allomuricauda aquimarina]BDW92241.1 transcriptional regulator [Allomuricauda aquimarina]